MNSKLHVRTGEGQVRIVDLAATTFPCVLGRDSDLAQLAVPDSQVSRAHCVINRVEGRFVVEDLGSRNGTWLNEKKITKATLVHGDQVRIGGTRIRVEIDHRPVETDPLVGKRLAGFDLLAVLGRGRYGVVYRGLQVALNRPVAVKLLAEEYEKEPEKVQSFLTEARRAGRLNHPNLVQVHDVCEAEGRHLLIMELMRASMADHLKGNGPVPEDQALAMLSDIAKALAYAESQRLVHRDVKPDNILVNDEGSYKLADLGIAAAIADDGQARQERTFGSPHYCAPEQARGGAIDGRADLYALGATAWHVVAGSPPFSGSSRQVIAAHLNTELPDLHELVPTLSEPFVELVYDLMEKDPTERPAHAQDVIKLIEDVRKRAKDDSAVGPRVRPRLRRRRRRR
ncbi:MAG TPA: FHA domain-containing serine/threonine-protein kinase [Planctomycetota bacterium]|nr:FHA domain-containing serine/threonine-protein kinase [Planctomycetota bacterium]